MRVLVLGGDGMLGHKVFQVLEPRFETVRHVPGLWACGRRSPSTSRPRPDRLSAG